MKITDRAYLAAGMMVMDTTPGIVSMRHRLPIARGACPYSRNPLKGWVQIEYTPHLRVLEVVALHARVQEVTSGSAGDMSAEQVAVHLARDCAMATGAAVNVTLVMHIRPQQRLVIGARGEP